MTQWLVAPLPHDKNQVHLPGGWGRRRWIYLNPKVVEWRDAQRARWVQDDVPECGPCEVDMHFHLPPAAEGKWWDVDHGISNVLDTMTGIVYEDDSLVERVVATRDYDAPQGEGYVDIFIYPAVL